jgi:hypothetical protein
VRTSSPSLSGVYGVHSTVWRAFEMSGWRLARIVGWQRPGHDLGARSNDGDHDLGEFADGELGGIANVDWTGDAVAGVHQAHEAVG